MKNYFQEIINVFINSKVSASSRDVFYRWITSAKHQTEKEKALFNLWSNLPEEGIADGTHNTQKSLREVLHKIESRRQYTPTRFLRLWQYAAAILLIALITTLYLTVDKSTVEEDLIELYVPVAEMTHLTLPDGTEVVMNATSFLLYPEQFTGKTRSVYLIGEANFKVARNEAMPFIVKSNDYQVTALGTEFTMRVYPDDPFISTTLLSGSVEVKYHNMEQSRILKPSEQFLYNKHTGEESVTYPDLSDIGAWQRGEMIFKSATLEEIIAELERKYPYTFVYTANTLKEDKYTFRFKSDTSLQMVMDIITEVSGGIRYKIEGDKCFILRS